MKLTNRDKFILTAVIVVVILILGAVFIVKPKIAEVNNAKSSLQDMKQKKTDTEAKLNTLDGLKEQLKELAKNVDELQSNFFDELETYEVDQHIRKIIDNTPIKVETISMELPYAEEYVPYVVYPQNVVAYDLKVNSYFDGNVPQEIMDAYEDVKHEDQAFKKITLTKYTITYQGEITKLIEALDEIDKEEQTLYVYSCAGGVPKEAEEVKSTICIYVLSVHKMDTEAINADE